MAADKDDTATFPLFIECLLEDRWPLLNVEKINEYSHQRYAVSHLGCFMTLWCRKLQNTKVRSCQTSVKFCSCLW